VLGIGGFGVIREAVYIPEARAYQRMHFSEVSDDAPLPNYLHNSDGTVVSLFEGE
jgi:hypothetical protein